MPTADVPTLPRLLIVDDEEPQMRALCETLSDHGFETTGFCDPRAALSAESSSPFDLLLCDLMMPGMNGIELLSAALQVDTNLVGAIMTGQGTIATAVALPVLVRALSVRRLRLDNLALQRRVQERNVTPEATNRELNAFASSVAHDLHAPMRHISAYARMLDEESGSGLPGPSKQYLTSIVNAAQRLTQLIDDLLNFSRTAHRELRLATIDLNQVVAGARDILEAETKDRKTISLPMVQADASLLQQVYYNLLSNAIKYTSRRPIAEIEIGCLSRTREQRTFFVKDNGVGFDMTHAERLFEVFQRLHGETEFKGSGVGLANVRRIISRHGGRTWAEGEVNQGACFYFTLPG